jgi:hypothetical protein
MVERVRHRSSSMPQYSGTYWAEANRIKDEDDEGDEDDDDEAEDDDEDDDR